MRSFEYTLELAEYAWAPSNMRNVALALVCFAFVSTGRRTHARDENSRDKDALVDSSRSLAGLLFASPQALSTRSRYTHFRNPSASSQSARVQSGLGVAHYRSQKPIMAGAAQMVEMQPPKTNPISRLVTAVAFSLAVVLSLLAVYPVLLCILFWSMAFDNVRRRGCDWIVQFWARVSLKLLFSKITVEGVENLPPKDEAVLYAPNHCSFLDIFALSAYLPRRFKYVSKIEILRIPFIGWAMKFAKHIAIRRENRASQLQTFKDAIACLEAGSSLVTFPEGTRSKDGRLCEFKKGPFTMAARSKRRVVPITIVGTHLFQPPGALFPYAPPRGVRIIVHPPVDVGTTKESEKKALTDTREAIMSALPPSMLPA